MSNEEQELELEELTFKEYIENDINNAFINADEFAEKHNIDNVEYICIVQDVNSAEALTIDKGGDYIPDLYGDAKTINIPKSSLEEVPVYGQLIYLDDERYDVVSVADDMGMLTILVVGNRR